MEEFELDKLTFFEKIEYTPHPGQLKLHKSNSRFRILACAARWGKSTAAAKEAMAAMLEPDSIGWIVAPIYSLSKIIFREVLLGWLNTRPDYVDRYSESDLYLRLKNGSECQGKSADNPASLLGVGLNWCVFDECALSKGEIWQQFLKPRLIDKDGWALFTTTPKGKGWLYHLYKLGLNNQNPNYYSQSGSMWENPIIDKVELFKLKPEWTQRYWDQEVLGMFIDDMGDVFKKVRSHIAGIVQEPVKGAAYCIGVDLAKHQDWTVITVMDQTGHVVFWKRLDQGMNWNRQKMEIAMVAKKYNNSMCYVDSSGIGDPIVDDLIDMGLSIIPVPTAQQKPLLIESLSIALENNKITYPDIPVLINELEIFEMTKTKTGKPSYNAPQGFHDDAVISLSLAVRGYMQGGTGVAIGGARML